MAYTITTTAGVALATIADGTVNTGTTSLTLIGKNYAGYGIFLNENYIKLLENFSNTTAPSAALTGQLWYDSTNNVLKVYAGGAAGWKPISSSAASSSAPTSPVTGDLWWDTNNAQLKVWSGSAWVTIGPSYTATAGTSGAVVETISDSSSISHVVVKFYISNSVIAILSKDSTFTPQSSIAGFTTVKPGMNLISANTLTGAQFTGDASNALTVNGITGSAYLRNDQNTSTAYQITAGGGIVIGSDLSIVSAVGAVTLTNSTNNSDLNLWVNSGGVSVKAIGISGATTAVTLPGNFIAQAAASITGNLTVTGFSNLQGITIVSNAILPNTPNTINIGAPATRFANVHAVNVIASTFYGNLIGQSTTSLYADLAERFESDTAYIPGTVVELGGIKEITAVVQDLSEAVFGVISMKAGFLMNGGAGTDITHPPVAINGRVPVRVIGIVTKGDRLVSAGRGLARAATRSELTAFNVIGRALENKTSLGEGTIEAIVKLNS
jgi:hypothetical protein